MLIFLYGLDTFRSKQKLRELKDKFKKDVDPTGTNIAELDGENLTIEKLRETVSAVSFFAKRRLVIVENFISKNKKKKIKEEMLEYLNSKIFPKDHIIIFWEKEISGASRTNPLFEKLIKEKYSQEFELLSETSLNKWVKEEVKKRGGNIESEAIKLLATYVGSNLWQMDKEIEKLIAYKSIARSPSLGLEGREINFKPIAVAKITAEDVNLLVKAKVDENIFNLMDAISEKNRILASKLIHDQLASGVNDVYLLVMLTRQFRILLEVKNIAQNNLSSRQISAKLGLHPFVVQKALAQVMNFTLAELKNIYHKLLGIDVKVKTGQARTKVLFDLFISELY